jgi:hypothetical protein
LRLAFGHRIEPVQTANRDPSCGVADPATRPLGFDELTAGVRRGRLVTPAYVLQALSVSRGAAAGATAVPAKPTTVATAAARTIPDGIPHPICSCSTLCPPPV